MDAQLKKDLRQLALAESSQDITWLDGIFLRVENETLSVRFPHHYFAAWFKAGKQAFFEGLAARHLGKPDLKFSYEVAALDGSGQSGYVQPGKSMNVADAKDSHAQPWPGDDFTSFICNEKNALALAAAKQAAGLSCPAGKSGAGKARPCQLLVICGPSGTGKSHLLNAVYKELASNSASLGIIKCKAAFFCARHSELADPARAEIFWRSHTALILDDLQELAAEKSWQSLLAGYIDNALDNDRATANNRGMVFAHGGMAAELGKLGDSLRSRLESGLVVELREPDLDVRLKFAEAANHCLGLGLGREQTLFLARHARQIPLLLGLLRKIEFFAKLRGTTPSMGDLESMASEGSQARQATWSEILNLVAARFRLKPEEIMSRSRKPDLVLARHAAMYICRRKLGLSYPELGRLFGGKDHSTVIHGIKKIHSLLETDKDMRKLLTELETEAGQQA